MAVEHIEKYRQKDGSDILKVILKPNKTFPDGAHFYADTSDEKLVKKFIWRLRDQKTPYVTISFNNCYEQQRWYFHQEKIYNIRGYYPDCINHINMIKFDNVSKNLDEVTYKQNIWYKPSRGYAIIRKSFQPRIMVDSQQICSQCVSTEVEAIQSVYQLEDDKKSYRYDFLKDRRNDLDILDLERTGQISEEEAIYRHVLRYADNAWYYYRYNLAEYFAENHIPVPKYSLNDNGFMIHSVTGQKLCPL